MSERTLLEQLRDEHAIDEDTAFIAQLSQGRASSPQPIVHYLLQQRLVDANELCRLQARYFGLEVVAIDTLVPDPDALGCVSAELSRACCALGFRLQQQRLAIAIASLDDVLALDRLQEALPAGITARFFFARADHLLKAIDRYYPYELKLHDLLEQIMRPQRLPTEVGSARAASLRVEAMPEEWAPGHPLVALVERILVAAVRWQASDLHLEPAEFSCQVRYRIDGVLFSKCRLPAACWPAIAARIKLLAELDIAELSEPQDGRLSLVLAGRCIDMRVATLPSLAGEKIVLRLLDHVDAELSLATLGFTSEVIASLQMHLPTTRGLVLVCGPTGSGKTTTLYALLRMLDTDRLNVMSIEDPIEARLPDVTQSAVQESQGFGFAAGVRAILRQDPDVILIGEVRDEQTAALAVRAAVTGHLVLASIHADTAVDVFRRLQQLGIANSVAADVVSVVISQRLVRRICQSCDYTRAKDCEYCQRQGYRGRSALVEVLLPSLALRELLVEQASKPRLLAQLRSEGYCSMQHYGAQLVAARITTACEVQRVLGTAQVAA